MRSLITKTLLDLPNGMVPPQLADSPANAKRARVLVVTIALLVALAIPFGIVEVVSLGSVGPTTFVFAVGTALLVGTLAIFRRTGALDLAGALVTLILAISLAVMSYFGGAIHAASLLWNIPVPLLALVLVGPRLALAFGAAVIGEATLFFCLHRADYPFPDLHTHALREWWHLLGLSTTTIAILLVVWLLQRERDRAEASMREGEANLGRAERLVSVGQLASGVAHEINNPLAFILANVDFVREELDRGPGDQPLDKAELTDALADTREGILRISGIVRELQQLAREKPAQARPADIRRILEQAIQRAGNEIKHRARLTTDFADVPLAMVDETQMVQVFLNLLVNAAQAIPAGNASENEIRVVVRCESPDRVGVEIHDTGTGISAEELERIFEPFYTTKPHVGTGLGLSICHGIVTSSGGQMSASSEPGAGSCFRVDLPAAAPTGEELAVMTGETPAPRQARVLVIDDEPAVCNAIVRSLRKDDVTAVLSGREAVDLFEREAFDFILCDLMMPEMTGVEVFRRLQSTRPGMKSKIVFMTGGVFTDEVRQFLEGEDHRVLEKPFAPEQVRALVRELTDAG